MPKTKKFKELSRRQQNRRLLQNKNISISLPKRLTNEIQALSSKEFPENEICNAQLSPEIDNVQSNDIDYDNNSEDHNLLDNDTDNRRSLREELHTWAIMYNVTQTSVTALLRILRKEGHNDLPSDARTLLGTPKNTIIRECGAGHYFYYGLQKALQEKLKYSTINNNIIEININIDGLPLAKSSQSQLWPILGQIHNIHMTEPFVIAAFHGYKKPTHANDLLEEFCNEYRILHEEGFFFQNKNYHVNIRAIICDAPAKSFVTCTKGHNAYYGCGKCFCEGDYINHKMVFLNQNAPLRTNSNFRTRENEEHHISISPLENLHLDMVHNLPLDYMHLICLGVTKKMLHLWTKGYHISRLRAAHMQELSNDQIGLREYIPMEFARRPRGLNELDRWKATEYRMFLLYLGPIILQKYLNADYFEHFCVLHTAIRILCHSEDCFRNNVYAKELLLYFVKMFQILYGNDNVVYNVHNLIHLSEDVKRYGPLHTFSAFPFENYLKKLKQMLRKTEKPLSQLYNRITENAGFQTNLANNVENAPLVLKPNKKQLPLGCVNSHKQIKLKNFTLTANSANNCCYLKDGSVFFIDFIGFKDKNPVIIGKKCIDLRPITGYPCNSQDMQIYIANKGIELQIIPVTEIQKKGFKVFFNNVCYIMPLLHL